MPETISALPYCGAPATPGDLAMRWNFDPWVMAGLAAAVGWWVWRRRQEMAWNGLAIGAMAVLAVIFLSPLCALSSALFSARVTHHALLISLAAPLLAFSPPKAWPGPSLLAATLGQAVVFWLWHAPASYAWALSNDAAYWLMQATLLGSAVAFWSAVRQTPPLAAAGALLATMVHMGLLGALITFAGAPLYGPHLLTTAPWGLSPFEDQQLAGLIMWAPMAGAYLLAALALVGRSLGPSRPGVATPS